MSEQNFQCYNQHDENVYLGISKEVWQKRLERMKIQEEYNNHSFIRFHNQKDTLHWKKP